MKSVLIGCILGLIISSAFADLYVHNPRGHNDRCDEQSNDRNDENRIHNSQDNAAGGYCINTEPMYYYMGSLLSVEWTSQHSCGNDGKVNCNYILQFACEDSLTVDSTDGPVRDGIPAANPENGNQNQCTGQISPTAPTNVNTGRNEPLAYFNNCNTRERNGGLLLLDQNLNGNSAQFTRQNAGGTTYGFECQEERDYYPYWQPTPWRDIAVLTSRPELCATIYQTQSQNVAPKYYCSNPAYNNQQDCTTNKGTWLTQQPWGMPAPDCYESPWGRDNHLGNTNDGYMPRYNWTLPYLWNNNTGGELNTCVLRMRYNISSGDYDDWNTYYTSNTAITKTIYTNPPVPVTSTSNAAGTSMAYEVQLAVDTAQYGRTFQDRTYHWRLAARPSSIDKKDTIWNVNVRGKRGNIAQVRNCVEYDFTPNMLYINQNDYVHFQWTGCDRNEDDNTGQGTDRTDRSNVCQMSDWTSNWPLPLEQQTMFDSYQLALSACLLDQTNCVPVTTLQNQEGDGNAEQDVRNCAKLNGVKKPINATGTGDFGPGTAGTPGGYPNNGDQTGTGQSYSAYFDLGAIRWNNTGTYHYMGTRNNDFTNRGQKAVLYVQQQLSSAAIAGIVVGSVVGATLLAGGGLFIFGRMRPDSGVASLLSRFGLL